MMQDAARESVNETNEVRTVEINEGNLTPLQTVEKAHVITPQSNFGADMSGSDDDEASEVDSFILDENDMDGNEEVLESKFLLAAETEEGQQQLQTVDPETHARLEALLEAAGISKLSSKDGKALTDPEVLRTLTSSVSSALDEATQAINCMRSEQQGQGQGAEGAQALSERDTGTVRKLYEGQSVPDTTEEGESLLSLACSAGYYELAQVLLAMNANVEDRGIKGDCTPLMEAASGGFVDIVRLLLLHGADVNAQSSAGNTPLHSAACSGHTNVVKELITNGALVEVHNENGHTPLMEAASAGHVEIAQQLLSAGAGINTHSNEFKESALTLACYKGHLEMVKFLLDAGADQEHKTDEMHTALMEASMDGHVEVARLLLDSGAQVNMPVDSFESPLTLAACGGHVELANLLIERGANIEEVNDEGYTPLMEAAREGHGEMVALLLSHGADINAQTEETQETALTLACCGGFKEVAEFLIKAGADMELGCSTPLMEAAQEGHLDLVDYLLQESANVHAQTGTNDTALTYACENGHTDVAMRLLSHGAFLEHESEGGRTPLMKAARAGHLCTVKYLIKQGANVNRSTSTNDHTVLSLACAGGHHQVVEELLNNGADPNHKLKDGSTMIIEAAKGGHTVVVKMLLEWPNRLMLNSSMDLAQPDMPHINMTQAALEEPRVPVQGLAHIVPPSEPDSQIPTCLNFTSSPGKASERQNGGKVVGKRATPTSPGVDGKLVGKTNNTVIADAHQPINHEGAVLADLTDEKATEKVEAIINNIMAKELLEHSGGSKEEQFKRQILEELQKVNKHHLMERELQDKAQAQQQLEQQQQQLLKARTSSASVVGSTGAQRSLAEPLCLTGSPSMESLPLKDLVVQLPKLLTSPDLAAQSLLPNPPTPLTAPSPIVSPGVSVAQQVQPPSPQFYQQPVPSTVVTNGNMGSGNSTGKVSKGRNASGKTPRTKTSQQQPPLPPPPPLQQPLPSPSQLVAQSVSSTVTPLALNLQMEHNGGSQSLQPDFAQQPPVQVSAEALQLQQQQHLAIFTQQQQQQIQQLSYQQLTTQQLATQQMTSPQQQQQQEQFLQQVLSQHQQVLQPALGQATFQQPLPQLLPQVPQQGQPAPQLLTQQERAQFYQQSLQATHLQHQLLKQTSTAVPSAATVAAIPNPASVATPSVPVDKIQGSLYPSSVDVDSQTESNHDTALTLACAGGHSELVSLLLAKGADMEHRDKKGFTPLILGATAGHLEVVEILLDHGADIEAQSERTKDTPLSLACSGGRYEVVELLLNRGANKEHRNVSDYTPLSLAASGGYVNIIKLLLSHGAEINSRTGSKLGISPLMLAAMNGHTQAVKLLLDMGSDINAQIETNRNTALTLACFQGRHEVVSLLVDRKANIEHRAKTGLTPLMEAASGGYVEVGRVLLDKGADVNAPPVPSSRDTALTIAADKGHYRFVELLLHRSASVDVKNKKGNSPLWLACNGGHLDVVQLLVTAGADIDSQDNRKVSCLMASFRKSHIKVVKWMVKHVSQFPSDTELQRFISTITDKELQKKCQQCMDIIVSAKDRQAAEANKNANSLLQEIDRERELDEQKRQIAARRRERRKERKKKGKLEKTKDNKDKNSSPEPESENGTQDQDNDDDDDDDNVQIEPPSATVTSTLGTTLVTSTEAKVSRSSSAKNSSHNSCPIPFVSSAVSGSQTPPASVSSSLVSEKRLQNAEVRKNRRNRKEKMSLAMPKESCVVSAAVITTAILSRASSVTTTSDIALVTNALGKVSLHSSTSSYSQMATTSVISSVNTNSSTPQSSANSKRKKNDVIKPVDSGKSRVGELDDFGSYPASKLFPPGREYDRIKKTMEKLRISSNDMLNLCEKDSTIPAKLSPLGTSPRKGQRKDEGWKEVTRKSSKKAPDVAHGPAGDECSNCRSKMVNIPGTASDECCHCRSKKVTVPASVISRVIGRGGCNINSIRETSGAHVDIEKSQKGAVDRVITIKGSAEATRMAHAMIITLVQEPEKDLSEIIARIKGKPVEKTQQTPVTIGDFAIGMFTVPTTTSHSTNSISQKSNTSKSGSSRQSAGSMSAVNGRSAGASVGQTPTNAWQNPVPGSGGPASPRRSPQKQLPPSLVPHSSSAPAPSLDKIVGRQAPVEMRRPGTATSTSTTVPLSSGTAAPSQKSLASSAAVRAGSELRQQAPPSSSAGVVGQKPSRPAATTSVRLLQRQAAGSVRADPQPLPIVSSHISNPSSTGVTSSSGMTSPANFSTFQLWNNSSPTPILSKKEDFASVAAAGVVPTQPSSHSGQAAPGSPALSTTDPTKAPGYKAGIGSTSPQSRTDHPTVGSSLPYPGPVGSPEHPDDFKAHSRGPMSAPSGMPVIPGLPNPAGDGGHMSPQMPFTGPFLPGGLPNPHPGFFPQQAMFQGPGSLVDQKEEYSTPHQPMTLPEIKSTLNPNAPDFQVTGTGGTGPGGMVNGFPPQMGDVRNGGDTNTNFSNGAGGGRVEAGGNNGVNSGFSNMHPYMQLAYNYMRNLPPAVLQQALGINLLGNMEQSLEFCYNLQRLYFQNQTRSGSPGPGRNSAPGPGGPHLNPDGMCPGPSPGPTGPGHMPAFMPRNVSPMPGQHRPNSAPCMPDSAPTTPVRPSNIGSPMPPCTPPLSEGKQTPDDRKVLRPIGGERAAAQRKLPLSDPGLGGPGDFKMVWGATEMSKEWMPATSPQMTAAAMPTSVMTSSVVTGSNMAYTLSQRENTAPSSDSMNTFHEPFPAAGMDPPVEPSLPNPQMMMQQMYPNGLNYNLTNMFGSRGSSGGGGVGEGGMAMWNQAVKAGPNEAGDSEAWRSSWSHTDM